MFYNYQHIISEVNKILKRYRFLLLILFLPVVGCSDENDKTTQSQSNKEHVFKQQKRALEKAKGVEQLLKNATDKHQQVIAEQSK